MFGTWLLLHPSALVGHESVPKAQAVATHSPPTQNLDQPATDCDFPMSFHETMPWKWVWKIVRSFFLAFFCFKLPSHLVQRSESRRCKGSSPVASPLQRIQRDVKCESPKRMSNLSPMTLNFCGQMICDMSIPFLVSVFVGTQLFLTQWIWESQIDPLPTPTFVLVHEAREPFQGTSFRCQTLHSLERLALSWKLKRCLRRTGEEFLTHQCHRI